jgi:hypothetical protein
MWKIWKYPITIDDAFELELPQSHKILKVGRQGDDYYMWVFVSTFTGKVKRRFRLFGTGHPIPGGPMFMSDTEVCIYQDEGGHLRYVDTIFQAPFVWHLFELVRDKE